ncbi:hypothetical protein SORBI_3007G103300 [Sorghum bicolor]|uniref:Uncharacterized protein n=1 Tax=Sorghum bicolor TaxID=4558 RepID=A0A1B6PH01_SORBI|nr:hypothetical protein SORBI_3007G103300 [Sorghum bicolor]
MKKHIFGKFKKAKGESSSQGSHHAHGREEEEGYHGMVPYEPPSRMREPESGLMLSQEELQRCYIIREGLFLHTSIIDPDLLARTGMDVEFDKVFRAIDHATRMFDKFRFWKANSGSNDCSNPTPIEIHNPTLRFLHFWIMRRLYGVRTLTIRLAQVASPDIAGTRRVKRRMMQAAQMEQGGSSHHDVEEGDEAMSVDASDSMGLPPQRTPRPRGRARRHQPTGRRTTLGWMVPEFPATTVSEDLAWGRSSPPLSIYASCMFISLMEMMTSCLLMFL